MRVVVLAGLAGCRRPSPPANVLLVVLDDLSPDRIGAWLDDDDRRRPETRRVRTPNLDLLAAKGVRFTQATSYPVCTPARAALLTGRYARRSGIGANIHAHEDYALSPEELLLPEMLDATGRGWYSAGVGKWHLEARERAVGADHPREAGFDRWTGVPGNLDADEHYRRYTWIGADGEARAGERYLTSAEVDEAVALVTGLPEPWFVMLALHAPHAPWSPPPEHLTSERPPAVFTPVPVLYDATMEATDTELGRLFGQVDFEDTVVVVLGDNGSPVEAVDRPELAVRSKGTLYEGGIRIPWIVAGAGVRAGVSDALVHVVDLFPTVMAHAGGRPGPALDGVDLGPILRGAETRTPRSAVFSEKINGFGARARFSHAIRDERYKLVRTGTDEELFELTDGRDGPNLLVGDPRPEAKARRASLSAELDRVLTDLGDLTRGPGGGRR